MTPEDKQRPHWEATYEELAALPPHLIGELLGGKLFASPRPASPQSAACLALGAELGGPFQRGWGGPGGWWYPVLLTLEVLRLHAGQWLEKGSWSGAARVRAEPFEALELELEALWFSESPEPG